MKRSAYQGLVDSFNLFSHFQISQSLFFWVCSLLRCL